MVKVVKEIKERDLEATATKQDIIATKHDLREYYCKTIITLGSIVAGVGGIIIAVLH